MRLIKNMQVRGGGRKTIGSDLSLNDLSPEAEVLSHRIMIVRKASKVGVFSKVKLAITI
jgi:hypothetical protein